MQPPSQRPVCFLVTLWFAWVQVHQWGCYGWDVIDSWPDGQKVLCYAHAASQQHRGPLVLQQLGEAVLPASQRLLTTTKGQWPWARQHAAMGSRGASLQGGEKAHLDPEAHSWRLSNMSSAQGPNLAGSQCPCWGAEKQTESVELVCLHFAIKSTCTLLSRRIEGEALSLSQPELRVRGSTGGYRSKQTESLCLCLGSSEKMVPARQKTQAPLPCLISLCPLGAAPSVPRAAVAPALMVEPQPSVSQRSLKK